MAVSLSSALHLLLFAMLFNTLNPTDVHASTCTYVTLHLGH